MTTFVNNKNAGFNYELQDKFESGVELLGIEVKALKNKRGNLTGAYVIIRGGEAFLMNAEIPPYQPNNTPDDYDPHRPRKLLLSKKELKKLADYDDQRGLTLIPISMYNSGRNIKLSFAVGRGKKKHDKRQTIKSREANIEMERSLKNKR